MNTPLRNEIFALVKKTEELRLQLAAAQEELSKLLLKEEAGITKISHDFGNGWEASRNGNVFEVSRNGVFQFSACRLKAVKDRIKTTA